MLKQLLLDFGFADKEADIYLTCLELGNAPVSSIARLLKDNRVTVYSILKNLVKKGYATEIVKAKTTYYSVIGPEKLLQKAEDKYKMIKSALPEFLAIANKFDNKPKVQFFDGIEGLKILYQDVILSSKDMKKEETFLTFAGTGNIDPKFEKRLSKEFAPRRLKFDTKTKAIITKGISNNYEKYHTKKHETLLINDPIFDFTNEIIVCGKNKVAIVMYNSNELSGLMIESNTLHNGLKSMFNLIWKFYKK